MGLQREIDPCQPFNKGGATPQNLVCLACACLAIRQQTREPRLGEHWHGNLNRFRDPERRFSIPMSRGYSERGDRSRGILYMNMEVEQS